MNRRGRQNEIADERCTLVLVPRMRSNKNRASEVGGWNAFVFRIADENYSVLGERTIEASASVSLVSWLEAWRPARVIAVLPPSATVCRMCTLPPAKGDQLASALRLQSETAFMGGIPTHRLAMAALPEMPRTAEEPGSRQGVILGWPDTSTLPVLPELPNYAELTFTPTIACLVSLLRGLPPSEPLVRVDREEGTLLFMLGGSNGLVLRSTLEANDDDATWRDSIVRTSAETLLSNDASVDEITALRSQLESKLNADQTTGATFLALPSSVRDLVLRRIPGSSTIDAERATALGAAMLSVTQGTPGALGELGGMRASLPKPKPQPIQLALQRLQSPKVAAWTIGVSIAVFVLAPLAAAAVRNGILRLKLDNLEAYEAENRATKQKAALYATLSKTTWPMTKLLGDLSNAMPDTIDVETIQVNSGQGITIRGVAKSTEKPEHLTGKEVVLAFESRARDTGIFNEFQYDIDAEDGRGQCNFTLVCSVKDPNKLYAWKDQDDNAKTSRRDRLYPNWAEIEKGRGGASGSAASASGDAKSEEHSGRLTPPKSDREGSGRDAGKSAEAKPETKPADLKPGDMKPDPKHDPKHDPKAGGRRDPKADPNGEEEGDPTEVKPVDGAGTEPPSEADPVKPGASNDRGINRRPRPTETNPDGTPKPATPQPSVPKVDVPAAFTDEELAAMTKDQAKELLAKIAAARQGPPLDPEIADRLKADFQRVLNRLKSNS